MEVEIASAGEVYTRMKDFHDRVKNTDAVGGIKYPFAELPFPLSALQFSVRSNSENYVLEATLTARTKEAFTNLSRRLLHRIPLKTRMPFKPTSADCTGYVIDEEQPFAVITDPNGKVRGVDVGSNGTIKRKVNDREDFLVSIRKLEGILNVIINTSTEASREGQLRKFPKDFKIYLNPF